jgi:hypothetical protein
MSKFILLFLRLSRIQFPLVSDLAEFDSAYSQTKLKNRIFPNNGPIKNIFFYKTIILMRDYKYKIVTNFKIGAKKLTSCGPLSKDTHSMCSGQRGFDIGRVQSCVLQLPKY